MIITHSGILCQVLDVGGHWAMIEIEKLDPRFGIRPFGKVAHGIDATADD
jgi:hypothetical protein